MKRILDPGFRYVPSFETDVRKTFERARREQREAGERPAPEPKVLRLPPQKPARPA